jgi:type II secretory pathway pseudopilin PulG
MTGQNRAILLRLPVPPNHGHRTAGTAVGRVSRVLDMKPPSPPPNLRLPRPAVSARGVTLVELLVVLSVIMILSGIVVSKTMMNRDLRILGADGAERSAEEIVTLATMQAVRDALLGTSASDPGYRGDLGRLPRRLGGLIDNLGQVVEDEVVVDPPYNPATKHGWHGPYIVGSGTRYGERILSADPDNPGFSRDGFRITDPDDPTPASILDDPAILDAWGKPLVLMQPDTRYARLVSAGPNRRLETDSSNPVDADRGDDLVIFLFSFDPNL